MNPATTITPWRPQATVATPSTYDKTQWSRVAWRFLGVPTRSRGNSCHTRSADMRAVPYSSTVVTHTAVPIQGCVCPPRWGALAGLGWVFSNLPTYLPPAKRGHCEPAVQGVPFYHIYASAAGPILLPAYLPTYLQTVKQCGGRDAQTYGGNQLKTIFVWLLVLPTFLWLESFSRVGPRTWQPFLAPARFWC